MSYSVNATGATKEEATSNIVTELNTVALQQEIHKKDMDQAKAAVTAFIGVMAEPDDKHEIAVSVNGYLSWNTSDQAITSVGFGINAGYREKAAT